MTWADASRRYAWHPVVLAVAIMTMLWVDAAVSPFAAARSWALTVLGVAGLYAVLALAIRDPRRSALLVTLLTAVLLSKSVVLTVQGLVGRMEPWQAMIWLALIVAVLLVAVRIVMRRWRTWTVAGGTYTLNVVSIAMLGVAVAGGVASGRVAMAIQDLDQGRPFEMAAAESAIPVGAEGESPPDIYVLMLDGYPRADILEEIFEYDNAPFLDGLADLGFEVADASHSDYLWTEHTMVSMLHRDYLERIAGLEANLAGTAPPQPITRELINDNPTFADLRAAGYEIVSIPTPIEGTAIRQSDILVDRGRLNEFEYKLLTSTFVGDVINVVAPTFGADQHRARIIDGLSALPQLAAQESAGPRLVFAHLLTPHWPAVWAADGGELNPLLSPEFLNNLLTQQTVHRETFIAEFRGHLEYTNGIVLEAMADVARADSDAVLVVMSDHGTWVGFEGQAGEPEFDLRERTGILFAARTPGKPSLFPESLSPVNVFRYLLDAYLGTDHGVVEPLPGGRHVEADADRGP